ncbi:NUDIX domain-containing protein [Acidisphaera sp. L21]|uniref:NUDIX domain-containing protein n=1 Tax=Acidisphaera sp. L21 TaxID=1641851 RepID=UPI00131C7FF1|nr:NUDIX domain-containing protein [Acidisphaera sp. L21]
MAESPDVTVLSTETVWKRRTQLDVVKFRQRRFDGAMSDTRTWEVWLRGHAVGVLPYDPVTDQLVMIEQFRYPATLAGLDPMMLEIPGGFMDAGETEQQTAAREMQEEMGLSVDRLHRVGQFILSAGGSDETVTIFAGRIVAPPADAAGIAGHGGLASENEDIRTRVLPAAATIESALAGRYQNSITAMALLWFASRRDWLRKEWAV